MASASCVVVSHFFGFAAHVMMPSSHRLPRKMTPTRGIGRFFVEAALRPRIRVSFFKDSSG